MRHKIRSGGVQGGKTARLLMMLESLKPGQKAFVAGYNTAGTIYTAPLKDLFNLKGSKK